MWYTVSSNVSDPKKCNFFSNVFIQYTCTTNYTGRLNTVHVSYTTYTSIYVHVSYYTGRLNKRYVHIMHIIYIYELHIYIFIYKYIYMHTVNLQYAYMYVYIEHEASHVMYIICMYHMMTYKYIKINM